MLKPQNHSPSASPANAPAISLATMQAPTCPFCQSSASLRFRLEHTSVYRCLGPQCHLQFASPQLDDNALAKAYEQLYYPVAENRIPTLENASDYTVRQLLNAIARESISPFGKRVLDYGCGIGTLLRVTKEMGADAVGIEQNESARDSIHRAGFARVHATLDDLLRDDPNHQFDLIFMCDVIEHLRSPWTDLQRIGSLVAPGGSLVVSTPNSESLRARLTGEKWDQRCNRTHFYYFTPATLSLVLRHAGFHNTVQLRTITDYEHHGSLRRFLQHALANLGLQGGLLFAAGDYSSSNRADLAELRTGQATSPAL